MRKGKGHITNGQYRQLYNLSQQENRRLRQQVTKLEHDYHSLKIAHNQALNKMLKDRICPDR